MSDYYNRAGEAVELEVWAAMNEKRDYKHVAATVLPAMNDRPALRVSTVWLGLNHNYMLDGPPLIFETMVFVRPPLTDFPVEWDDGEDYGYNGCVRYTTEADALLGHLAVVSTLVRGDEEWERALSKTPATRS